jgi:hypothetical protein
MKFVPASVQAQHLLSSDLPTKVFIEMDQGNYLIPIVLNRKTSWPETHFLPSCPRAVKFMEAVSDYEPKAMGPVFYRIDSIEKLVDRFHRKLRWMAREGSRG